MNSHQKYLSSCLLMIAALLYSPSQGWAQTAPNLGTAANFAVLSVGTAPVPLTPSPDPTAAVTTTNSNITGDVGSAGAITLTNSSITGNLVHSGALTNTTSTISGTSTQPLPAQVITDFNSARNALAPQPGDVCPIITGTLAGVTLAPGVHCVSAEAKTGVLTLNGPANGIWIFKVAADATGATGALTGTNFTVVMTGGGLPCNVFWWVAEAATMTDSQFNGTILAGAGTTMTRGSLIGRALAKAGMTFTGTTVIGCGALAALAGATVCDEDDDDDDHDGDREKHKKHKKHGDNDNEHGDKDNEHRSDDRR